MWSDVDERAEITQIPARHRHMGLVSKARALFFGGRRAALKAARRAEGMGQLDEATALYLEGEAPEEASRLLALRADAAASARERYLLLRQAESHARGEPAIELERRRRRLAVDLVRSGELGATRAELAELASALGRLGEPALAAEIYRRLGDAEAEAHMLVEAGAIERLESVLDAEQERERKERREAELGARVRDLVASGQRRLALEEAAKTTADDVSLSELVKRVTETRVTGARVTLEIGGERLNVVFGEEVTLGRAGATVALPSPAISREHLALRRSSEGPVAVDLGSRNGTLLAGARLDVPLVVTRRSELALGGELPVVLEPWGSGGLRLECGSERLALPLGPLRVERWTVAPGPDGWLELEPEGSAWLGPLRVHGRIQLCRGDELRGESGTVALRVVS